VVRNFAAPEVDGHAGASRSNDRPLLFVNAWLNAGWRSGIVVTLLVGPGDRNALRAEPNHHHPTEAETASRGPLDLRDQAGVAFPAAPRDLRDTGIDPEILADLVLKVAYTAATFTTDTAAARVCLPTHLVAGILEGLKVDRLVQILGPSGTSGYRFTITERGREHAVRLLEISKYIGPAPVSLEAYAAALASQLSRLPPVSHEGVEAALAELVLPMQVVELAGFAAFSGRSLFIHGPPGTGKTTLAHLVHNALSGQFWIPHCIGVDAHIIRVFDPRCHDSVTAALPAEVERAADRRWVCIRRPFIVAAGELTIKDLELAHSHARGYYEAPVHLKANGGTFLLDDFGRQRIEPRLLLNRWTFPLEHGVDYLTLETGQRLEVPFSQLLIVCTNLDPDVVMDPAFLRRMGYRLLLDDPSPEAYAHIFTRYAARCALRVPPGLLAALLERYRVEQRRLRSCEPRDLIERARDICRYRDRPLELTDEIVDSAWKGYFGRSHS